MRRRPPIWYNQPVVLRPRAPALAATLLALTACPSDAPEPARPALTGDPGTVPLHRLNRAEYTASVKALFERDLDVAADFPPDDHAYGFDNIAAVLSLSPLQIELYEAAAQTLVEAHLGLGASHLWRGEQMTGDTGAAYRDAGWRIWGEGVRFVDVELAAGAHEVVVGGFAGSGAPQIEVALGGRVAAHFLFGAAAAEHRVVVTATAGPSRLSLWLANPGHGDDGTTTSAVVTHLRIEARTTAAPPVRLGCDSGESRACAAEIIGRFSRAAWRRGVTDAEQARLLQLYDSAITDGESHVRAVALMMQACLLAPHFIFRVEHDPEPGPHWLDDHALASRLAYFLWSAPPDDVLLQLADDGALNDDPVLREQVARMLAAPRARALVDNFAGQWLYLRYLDSAEPDPEVFAEFDDELAASMKAQTARFFESLLSDGAPITDLITADYDFVDRRLAELYGLPVPSEPGFHRVSLAGSARGGLLTQGGWLTVTSYPNRTSPVKRGKWVLKQLLCDEPPDPPAGVDGIDEMIDPNLSLREKMRLHRTQPICASCHLRMDPIGFAFEHFDGIGRYRTEDGPHPIDASGMLPDGDSFTDHLDLATKLAEGDELVRCTAKHMLVYALGRGVSHDDDVYLDTITAAAIAGGGTLPALIEAIALSVPFRARRGTP